MSDLRTLRKQRVLSQQELAEKAGVSKTTIVGLEARRIRSYPATIRKIAMALGVEPSVLAYLQDKAAEEDTAAGGSARGNH